MVSYDRGRGGKVEGSSDKLDSSGLKMTHKKKSLTSLPRLTKSAEDRAVDKDHVGGQPKIQ